MAVRLKDLQLGKEIGIVALAALLLSLGGVALDVWQYVAGENVEMLPPAQIDFFVDPATDSTEGSWLIANASVTYVNDAAEPYNGLVTGESVRFSLPVTGGSSSRLVTLNWQSFVQVDPFTGDIEPRGNADPVLVPAGGAVSHETSFFPDQVFCVAGDCDSYMNFIDHPSFVAALRQMDSLTVTFLAETYNGRTLTHECVIAVTDFLIETLVDYHYYPAPCRPL